MRVELTNTEWAVLNCLWEQAPLTLMQLVTRLSNSMGWAKSTTTTMVKRMEEKGLIVSHPNGRGKDFFPNINREEAAARETKNFLERVYHGSVSMMMSAMAESNALTQRDIDHLYAILKEAEVKQS